MRFTAAVALALAMSWGLAASGCKTTVARFCEDQADCDDERFPYCDVAGAYPESAYIASTCIPLPAGTDKTFCVQDLDCPSSAPFCTDARECRGCADNAECGARDSDSAYCDPTGACLACEPDTFLRCDGDDNVHCASDGSGLVSVTCTTQCDASEGRCLDCTPDQFLRCDDLDSTQLIACSSDGASEATTTCAFECNATRGGCDECDPSIADTCDAANSNHVACNGNGQITADETCVIGCDGAGQQCRASCTPGEFLRCPDSASIATCAGDGASATTASCAGGTTCDATAEQCGVCDTSAPVTTDAYLGLACSGDANDCCGLTASSDYACIVTGPGAPGFCASACTSDTDCSYPGAGNAVCVIDLGSGPAYCGFSCTVDGDCPSVLPRCAGTICASLEP